MSQDVDNVNIIDELINGANLDVTIAQIPLIKTRIEEEKEVAIASGDVARLKSLQNAQKNLNIIQKNEIKKRKEVKKKKEEMKNKLNHDDIELQNIMEHLFEDGNLDDLDDSYIVDLISFSRRKMNESAKERKFLEAQRYIDTMKTLITERTNREIMNAPNNNHQYKTIIDGTDQKINCIKVKQEEELEDLNNRTKITLDKLRDEHLKKLKEIDEKSKDPSAFHTGKNTRVLQLRESAKQCANLYEFIQADAFDREADKLEEQEIMDSQNIIRHIILQKKNLMERSYQSQKNIISDRYEFCKRQIIRKKQKEIEIAKKSKQNYQSRIVETRKTIPYNVSNNNHQQRDLAKSRNSTFVTQRLFPNSFIRNPDKYLLQKPSELLRAKSSYANRSYPPPIVH